MKILIFYDPVIRKLKIPFIILFCAIRLEPTFAQSVHNDYLLLFYDEKKEASGYKDPDGNIIIAAGKYAICSTDTFRTYAIVLTQKDGFVAIDRHENILYQIFPFDNGPDYPSDGLFRILVQGKIGYADSLTGKIIIPARFDCAFPFKNGTAKVSEQCRSVTNGEHTSWLSENWYYIDKNGNAVATTDSIQLNDEYFHLFTKGRWNMSNPLGADTIKLTPDGDNFLLIVFLADHKAGFTCFECQKWNFNFALSGGILALYPLSKGEFGKRYRYQIISASDSKIILKLIE